MDLVLAAYHRAGCAVLEHAASRPDVDRVTVYTHEPGPGVPDIRERADALGAEWTTERLTGDTLHAADIVASVYYRSIVPVEVIQACEGRIFNAHPSLLPRHRGASSLTWAMVEGDTETGVTFHYIDEGVDTGPILFQARFAILPDDTQATLYDRAMDVVVENWPRAFELVRDGVAGEPQGEESSYHGRGAPYDGEIQDSWPDAVVERFIRAMINPPYPPARYRGENVLTFADYERLRSSR